MAAHLDTHLLRQHALTADIATQLERAVWLAPPTAAARSLDMGQAPVASWHVGHDGRLACRWTVGGAAIPAFPSD